VGSMKQAVKPPGRHSTVKDALTLDDLRTRPTVTIEQAGAVLGLSRTSAYAAARRNEIPHIVVGRRKIVSTQALLRMLEVEHPAESA